MAQVAARDQQCAATNLGERCANRGHKLGGGCALVIIRNWRHQWIWNQRRKQGNIAVEMLQPWNVHLYGMLAKVVNLIRVNTLGTKGLFKERQHGLVSACFTKRRHETIFAHHHAIANSKMIGAQNDHAVWLLIFFQRAIRGRVARPTTLIIQMWSDQSKNGPINFWVFHFTQPLVHLFGARLRVLAH